MTHHGGDGAGSGIGLVTSAMIIRDGGSVLAVDKVEDRLVAARQRLGEAYTPLAIDITSPTAPATIAQAVDGPVDILVNNAGVMDGFLPLAELDDETWEHVMAVNITAAVRLTARHDLRGPRSDRERVERGRAQVDLRGPGLLDLKGGSERVHPACRGSVFLRRRSLQCGGAGAVNTTPTDILSSLAIERLDPIMMSTSCGRRAEPDMIANAICFLADDHAAVNINGVVLPVDAAWSVM